MTTWTSEQLAAIDADDELDISSQRPDGSLRPFITIWAVRAGDELFVRSAYGSGNGWYRRALASGTGRIRVGSTEYDVAFAHVDEADAVNSAIDDAYRSKYARYSSIVGGMVGPAVHDVGLRLDPR